MKFATVRSAMFQIHMWVGLILGVLLVLVSLSGSILVYDDKLAEMLNPAPKANTAGMRLPLTFIADAAREAAGEAGNGQVQIVLPLERRDPAIVRFTRAAGGEMRMGAEGAPRREGGEGFMVPGTPVALARAFSAGEKKTFCGSTMGAADPGSPLPVPAPPSAPAAPSKNLTGTFRCICRFTLATLRCAARVLDKINSRRSNCWPSLSGWKV